MTRPKVSRQPVSSFGPELMQILIEGSRRRIEIPCDSMNQMKHLQLRLHSLRSNMQKEKHPMYTLSTRARTACTWDYAKHPSGKGRGKQFPRDATGCKLVVAPHDSQFGSLLERAGIKVDPNTQNLLDEVAAPSTPVDPSIQASTPPEPDPLSPIQPTVNPYKDFTR